MDVIFFLRETKMDVIDIVIIFQPLEKKNNSKEIFQVCPLTLVLAYQPHQLLPVSTYVFLLVLLFLHLLETFYSSVYCLVLHVNIWLIIFPTHTTNLSTISISIRRHYRSNMDISMRKLDTIAMHGSFQLIHKFNTLHYFH